MGTIIYISGGARSGKSSFAEKKALEHSNQVLYIATAIAFDKEMADRIRCHQERRPGHWQTIEAYKGLASCLQERTACLQQPPLLLLDCLTVMVTNILMEQKVADWDAVSPEEVGLLEKIVEKEVDEFLHFIKQYKGNTLIVSNELGMGLVPPSRLGRYFRDIQGRMNQKTAEAADQAYFLVSGLPLQLK